MRVSMAVLLAWMGVATIAVAGLWSLIGTALLAYSVVGLLGAGALLLVSLACCVNGPRGQAAGLGILIATALLAPWYALLAHGEWTLLLATYGGQLSGLALICLAILLDGSRSWPAPTGRRAFSRASIASLRRRTFGIGGA